MAAIFFIPTLEAQNEPADPQATANAADANQAPTSSSTQPQKTPSVLGVAPGTPVIKDKDLYDRTGYLHPFVRMPKFVLVDQRRIWTSPFHTSRKDAKWWYIFGGATAALIVADQHIEKAAPNNSTLIHVGNDASYLGTAYTLIPITAGFYFVGTATHNDRFREAGLLGFEALSDVTIVQLAVKSITDRERPYTGSGEGHFFDYNGSRYNSSFPSGHAIETFALASVFAHEYHDKFWVKFLAYLYAGGVVGARLAADKHFPSDTLVGGTIGWFVGDYVYAHRHNPEVAENPSLFQKVLAHVSIGGPTP